MVVLFFFSFAIGRYSVFLPYMFYISEYIYFFTYELQQPQYFVAILIYSFLHFIDPVSKH